MVTRANTAVGDNLMLQRLVWEAVATQEPERMGLCHSSICSELCVLANHLTFLYFSFSMHKMETMEASTSVGCLEDYIMDFT